MTPGAQIKALRESRKWSQDELGAKTGITKAQLSKWENGKIIPSLTSLQTLAKVFGVPVNELANPPASKITEGELRELLDRIKRLPGPKQLILTQIVKEFGG